MKTLQINIPLVVEGIDNRKLARTTRAAETMHLVRRVLGLAVTRYARRTTSDGLDTLVIEVVHESRLSTFKPTASLIASRVDAGRVLVRYADGTAFEADENGPTGRASEFLPMETIEAVAAAMQATA